MHSHARVVILIKRTHVKINVHCICEFTGLFVFVLFVWIFFGMRIISVRNNVINLLNQELIGLLFSSHSFNMSNLITFYMKNISFEGCWILKMLSVTHLHSMSIFFFIILITKSNSVYSIGFYLLCEAGYIEGSRMGGRGILTAGRGLTMTGVQG